MQADMRVREARWAMGGFAFCQAFFFAVFYAGESSPIDVGGELFGCPRLVFALVGMIAAFSALRALAPAPRGLALSPRAVALCSLLALSGVALRMLLGGGLPLVAAEGLLEGVCAALLLSAWARVLGAHAIDQSVPEVLIASALGAAACFALSALPVGVVECAMGFLPLLSAVFLTGSLRAASGGAAGAPAGEARTAQPSAAMSDEAFKLSGRILSGTAVFGVSAGFVEVLAAELAQGSGSLPFTLLLFVVFCLAALQLFGPKPIVDVRAVLPQQASGAHRESDGPLAGSYRLAVLLMMAGFLLVPVLRGFGVAGESVVLAGYLGVLTVLVSLFLVMGHLGSLDAALSFAYGFTALFAGELAGIVAGNAISSTLAHEALTVMVALAGVAVLYGFMFLFTERDIRSLSVVVRDTDLFEEACARIVNENGLSRRESEILPLALRGRTSERIAAEFFITKNTVDTHMRRIYAKCGVASRQELIDLGEATERSLKA